MTDRQSDSRQTVEAGRATPDHSENAPAAHQPDGPQAPSRRPGRGKWISVVAWMASAGALVLLFFAEGAYDSLYDFGGYLGAVLKWLMLLGVVLLLLLLFFRRRGMRVAFLVVALLAFAVSATRVAQRIADIHMAHEGLPAELAYPGATDMRVMSFNSRGRLIRMYTFFAPAPVPLVTAYYESSLAHWHNMLRLGPTDSVVLTSAGPEGDKQIMVQILPDGQQSSIMVLYGPK